MKVVGVDVVGFEVAECIVVGNGVSTKVVGVDVAGFDVEGWDDVGLRVVTTVGLLDGACVGSKISTE